MTNLNLLSQQIESSSDSFVNNGRIIAKENSTWRPAPKSKSALEIVNHVSYVNIEFTKCLNGISPFQISEENWRATMPELSDFEKAVEYADETGKDFAKRVSRLTPDELEKTFELPWGMRTIHQVIQDLYWHLIYHLGQICYIQTLLGDMDMHL